MKRARSEDAQQDADEEQYIGDSSADEAGDDAPRSSSSSDSDDGEVEKTDLGDAIQKEPLGELLLTVLMCMIPLETGAAAAGRLSTQPGPACSTLFNDLVSVSVKCSVQHNLEIMSMQREALCRRAKLELLKGGNTASDVPSMWVLQWVADKKQTVHGPFTTEVVQQWKANGFFDKKKATISDANELKLPRVWADPTKIDLL